MSNRPLDPNDELKKALKHLSPSLVKELASIAKIQQILKDTEILREGQYVKVIPIVLEGLIKVFTRHEDKELLLYYIKPNESCVMSFSSGLKNEPSKIFAVAEEDSTVLLLPATKMDHLSRQFPDFNTLYFQQYNLRYSEMLDTINHLLFDRLDKRLLDYLVEKKELTHRNPLKLSHRQIANELGTSREVISRVMKKLEVEGKLKQHSNSIELL